MISIDSVNSTPKYLFKLDLFPLCNFSFLGMVLISGLFLDVIYISNALFHFSGFQLELRNSHLLRDLFMTQQKTTKMSFLTLNPFYLSQLCQHLPKVKLHVCLGLQCMTMNAQCNSIFIMDYMS